ncbi:hypothetical protein [Chryseobacterium sp. ERMR1:04]|uniref:hypothetical protein n=1 Tax=Chryseobacterium sp. ERMR1:04 TaxID=1705393 RepID=UPI0006C89B11|nr:hypothetical protein [Chryseobacterium sp. ERMR1:04]KPH13977.1 hypothetical protein AMQ68_00115 [Chryseobacterium sp. ERMR1:04]
MKNLEKLKGKKLGNLKDVIGGKIDMNNAIGPCGGTGSYDDPHVLETLTLIKGGGGKNDGCD